MFPFLFLLSYLSYLSRLSLKLSGRLGEMEMNGWGEAGGQI
jgi:hypothetical protein